MKRKPFVVGLTGGIASGKTLASDRFAAHGVRVVDTDVIAREIVQPGEAALDEIVAHFGPDILAEDGHLDRASLRQRVFASPADRRQLEAITHPRIRDHAIAACSQATGLYVVLVVPLLVESPLRDNVDRILVVDCPPETQLARLLARDGSDETTAKAIIAAQASRADRVALADDVVVNDKTRAELIQAVDALHRFYRTLAALGRAR